MFSNLLILNIKNQNHSVMDNRYWKTSLRICQISGEFCELLGMLPENGLQKIPLLPISIITITYTFTKVLKYCCSTHQMIWLTFNTNILLKDLCPFLSFLLITLKYINNPYNTFFCNFAGTQNNHHPVNQFANKTKQTHCHYYHFLFTYFALKLFYLFRKKPAGWFWMELRTKQVSYSWGKRNILVFRCQVLHTFMVFNWNHETK